MAAQAAAQSQGAAPAPAAPVSVASPAPPSVEAFKVPAKTLVDIEITQALDSKTAKPGERFTLRLASPIVIAGQTLVPAGVAGEGEVIHAAKARFGGKAGELVLAARFVDCGAVRVPLGYFKFGAAGENRSGSALAASMVVPFAGLLIAGGELRVVPGARANAKVRSDVLFTEGVVPACTPPVESQPQPEGGHP